MAIMCDEMMGNARWKPTLRRLGYLWAWLSPAPCRLRATPLQACELRVAKANEVVVKKSCIRTHLPKSWSLLLLSTLSDPAETWIWRLVAAKEDA